MGGYSYSVDDEKIREFKKLSDEDKLRWLEEFNDFINRALTPKEKKIMEKFRRGEI